MNVVKGLQSFFENNADIIKIVILIVLVGVVAYLAKCGFKKENLFMEFATSGTPEDGDYKPNITGEKAEAVKDYNDMFYGKSGETQTVSEEFNPEQLLPKTELNGDLKDDTEVLQGNFVNAGFEYPVDTVGGTMKKLNYSLRSVPQIPVNRDISPFMMSSWEADKYSKPLE